ncbi:hypothetical protein Q0F99_01690 [Rathayibacter oskolensis]|uniref:hypothetical protein n=1 Tax=Rathayibacter oskolensis TaxID=1891671 RepID=UPI00265FB639|nr:hypothetical protein [Rathayibacter oskolensis]WKK71889.1 hypothetical protein Q0F99_01690 [Rathayibacter oskolensis]
MQIDDEQQLKQRLGIDSWRNVSRDSFIDFATVLPSVSEELGRRILEQFPDFKALVLDSLVGLRDQAAEGDEGELAESEEGPQGLRRVPRDAHP